ncbi:membrane-associated protease RseP (regulator of RpoE activity) [Variovorax boronicumulans]|uniref:site-2 protease family protein n=1 Tax=Variovorax boronicumulans TaxID=436515 RepID=UPI0027876077|nr:site-2 protease family protein [Variovorax boronicumulans]MDQ0073087.1 membrane-associated protease RseP (regulator of RpoE activity) [Variovorax boronicumulans]
MLIALKFIAAIALLAALHIAVMAVLGNWLGIKVRRIAFGIGPVLLSRGLFELRLLPLGGSVTLKDTRVEWVPDDVQASYFDDAFNHRPRAVQVLLPLLGAAALVLVAVVLHPGSGLVSVGSGFVQIVAGALGPLSTAQALLEGTRASVVQYGFVSLLGLVAAKLAALNLLPLSATNGGQALLALMTRDLRSAPSQRLAKLSAWSAWLWVALALSWLVAIGFFAVQFL